MDTYGFLNRGRNGHHESDISTPLEIAISASSHLSPAESLESRCCMMGKYKAHNLNSTLLYR